MPVRSGGKGVVNDEAWLGFAGPGKSAQDKMHCLVCVVLCVAGAGAFAV